MTRHPARAHTSRDLGALPGPDELRAVCAAADLDDRDAELLHVRSNAVYRLPREDLVLRLARDTAVQVERAHKIVTVCRWLAERNGPTLAPAELPQPVVVAGAVATTWPALPPAPVRDPAALGVAVRELHTVTDPPPPLPTYRPLVRLREALAMDAARTAPVLTANEHAWLTDRADQLTTAYHDLHSPLGHGLIHCDAHTGNLLRAPRSGPRSGPHSGHCVLIDFDQAAFGPRELDLICAAPDNFQIPRSDRAAFSRAYGYDLLSWPGWRVLRDIRMIYSLASYLRRAATTPAAASQLALRLHSLRTNDLTIRWTPIN